MLLAAPLVHCHVRLLYSIPGISSLTPCKLLVSRQLVNGHGGLPSFYRSIVSAWLGDAGTCYLGNILHEAALVQTMSAAVWTPLRQWASLALWCGAWLVGQGVPGSNLWLLTFLFRSAMQVSLDVVLGVSLFRGLWFVDSVLILASPHKLKCWNGSHHCWFSLLTIVYCHINYSPIAFGCFILCALFLLCLLYCELWYQNCHIIKKKNCFYMLESDLCSLYC